MLAALAGVLMTGCGLLPDDAALVAKDHRAAPATRACAATQVAIARDMDKLVGNVSQRPDVADRLGAAWGICKTTTDDGRTFDVAHFIRIPHRDENGAWKPDTFYYATVKLNDAGEAHVTDLSHD